MFGVRLSKMGSASKLGLIAKAIGILRKYGADAHVYLPGIGTVNGLTAGNYLDSAGTTAATVDNPVGLSLDALQAMTLGVQSVVDPSFDDASKWTPGAGWSVSGGAAVATAAGSGANIQPSGAGYLATVNGSPYVAEVVIGSVTSGSCQLIIWNGSTNVASTAVFSAPGTYQVRYIANNTQCRPYLAAQSANTTLSASSISNVPEPGIHATQATTANKPILRRGMLNLLRQSQALATTPWAARIGTIVATNNFAVGLDGTTTATKLDKTGVVDAAWQQNIDTVMSASTPYTAVFILQKSVTTKIAEVAIRTVLGGIDRSSYVDCDTLSGATYVRVDTGTPAVTVSVADASTYWVIALNKTSASGASSDSDIIIRPYIGTTLGVFDDTATGSCVVWRAGLFQGTLTAQQIIDAGGIPLTTSAAASSATGKYWGQFDSTDLLTATYPAGYESATIINALTSGVTTTQGVNVVGSYSIGPSVNTAGRIVLKTAPTAEKLAVLQSFMGLLI